MYWRQKKPQDAAVIQMKIMNSNFFALVNNIYNIATLKTMVDLLLVSLKSQQYTLLSVFEE